MYFIYYYYYYGNTLIMLQLLATAFFSSPSSFFANYKHVFCKISTPSARDLVNNKNKYLRLLSCIVERSIMHVTLHSIIPPFNPLSIVSIL